MFKRFSMLVLALLLTISMAVPVFATGDSLPRLVDEADVLSASEEAKILAQLDEVSTRQGVDVVIAVVNDFDAKDVDNAAYDYYDYNGFSKDGILLYLSMAERDYCISGTGFGIRAFTDYGREKLAEELVPYLSEGDYYTAFSKFAFYSDDYITVAKEGKPYDVNNEPVFPLTLKERIIGALASFFGPVIAAFAFVKGIIIRGNRKKLLSVGSVNNANEYMEKGSLNITRRRDMMVDTVVTEVYNPDSTDGGGSTISKGSSGIDHSSTSGKF